MRDVERFNSLPEAVSDPNRDIVEQVSASRISGRVISKGREGMNSTKQTKRIAGVLYLVSGVNGFFGIVYVPHATALTALNG